MEYEKSSQHQKMPLPTSEKTLEPCASKFAAFDSHLVALHLNVPREADPFSPPTTGGVGGTEPTPSCRRSPPRSPEC